MENAITLTQQLIANGYTLVVAVINVAVTYNIPVADLLAAVSK